VKKFSLKVFLKVLKYVFRHKNAEYLRKNTEMLYKNREMFKLFEDNEPRFISFEELVPDIYSREEIEKELNDEDVKKNLKYVNFLPGGK
jgi:Ca2+-binding EF-hand superfamily protein